MEKLIEIKKGQEGRGLLFECDGYVNPSDMSNKDLQESYKRTISENTGNGSEFYCPYPLIYNAVLQRYGSENANGRIYPEGILKREVEKYQQAVNEKRAMGECYSPEAMILTEAGWKKLSDVKIGENVLTLNSETKEIEVKPIQRIIKKSFNGNLIHISGRSINDLVTPEHGFPIYDRNDKFKKFITAKELLSSNEYSHYYIPKIGNWIGKNDESFVIPALSDEEISTIRTKNYRDKYSKPLVIPMEIFAKFMGIYLSEGSHSKKNTNSYKINIHQKKDDVCVEIEKMLDEWGIKYTINREKSGSVTFVINDMRLCKYVQQFGLCYDKFVPFELKQQNPKILRIFYDWFVMGDGRVRGDKRIGRSMSDDVFSTSSRLTLDLNEIQLKIGYSGNFLMEERNKDRLIEGRLIKAENSKPMYFTYRSLTKGIYMDKRFLSVFEEEYNGDVMCVEVENHIWYVMDNGKCHWTKNCNHPSDIVIDLSRVAINVVEMHWEGNTLVGKIEVITSEGFRKHGIISCQGDQVANLLLSGYKIGLSSRGLGSVTKKMDTMIVGDDFELVCFDVVSEPSTKNAWIVNNSDEIPSEYVHPTENMPKNEAKLFDKLEKFSDWLKN